MKTDIWNVRGTNYTVQLSHADAGTHRLRSRPLWRASCPDLRLYATAASYADARADLRQKMMDATRKRRAAR